MKKRRIFVQVSTKKGNLILLLQKRNHIRSYHNHEKKCKLCPQEIVFDIDLQKHVDLVHKEAAENRDNL